jgi:hypothetical protein
MKNAAQGTVFGTAPLHFTTYLPSDSMAECDAREEEMQEMLEKLFDLAKSIIRPGWEISSDDGISKVPSFQIAGSRL